GDEPLAQPGKLGRIEHEHDALQLGLHGNLRFAPQEHDRAAVRRRHARPAQRAAVLALDVHELETEEPVEADRALDLGDIAHRRGPSRLRVHAPLLTRMRSSWMRWRMGWTTACSSRFSTLMSSPQRVRWTCGSSS